jgi:tetratricopeptide (TPR) repeat protein
MGAGAPPRSPPAPASPPGGLGEIDELMDLPAVPDEAGLPAIARPGLGGKPALPPGASRPQPAGAPQRAPQAHQAQQKPQPPSLSDFEIDLPSAEADLPAAKAQFGPNRGLSFDVDLPSPAADLPSAKPGGRRDHADLPAVAAGLPSTKTSMGFGEIDLPVLGGNLPAVPSRDHNLPSAVAAGLPLPVVGGGLPVAVSAGLPSALGGSNLPAVANALPQVANALPQVANALPQVANALPAPIRDDRHLPSAKNNVEEMDFGELELKSLPPPPQGDVVEELELPPSRDPQKDTRASGGTGFGEVDLGADTGEAVAMDDVARPLAKGGGGEVALPTAPAKRRERTGEVAAPSRAPKLVLALLAVVVVVGTLMQLTPYGWFGYIAVDDLMHESSWGRMADDASQKARAAMAPDVFDQSEKALDDLAQAHADSPRARPLTAYAALAECEAELRFGKDGARAARAQSWLADITAKSPNPGDVRYFTVASAVQAANNGDFAGARSSLDAASKKDVGDPVQQDIALARGELELAGGDPAAAATAFTRAAQLAPSARAHFGLARAYALGEDGAKARTEIAATLAASPHHAGALVLRAAMAWSDKSEADATRDLHEVFQGAAKSAASPSDLSKAYALLGWMQSARGKSSEARDSFEAALKLNASNADALVGQGEVLYTEGRFAEALSRFDTAVQVEPHNVRAIVADAKAKIALERLADAKAQLTAARTTFPSEMKIAYWLGKVEEALGNKKAAEDGYIAAIALANPSKPDAIDPYVALAEMLAGQGRATEAQAKLNEAKGKLPDSAAMERALGQVAAVQGQYDEAVAHYQAAVQKDPDDLSSRFLLGQTYRRMQRLDLAAAELDKVLAADKDYPQLAMERGLLFEQANQIDKALEQFQSALQKAPTDVDLQLRVGAALVGVHRPDDALVILKKVRDKRPNSAEVNHYLGRAYFLKGGTYLADAKRGFLAAVEQDPNRPEYHFYLAWVATEASPADVGTAQTEVDRALALDKLYGDAYWQRGVVERINSAVDDAIKDLKHALQLRPTRYEAHATLAECYEDKNNMSEAMAEWAKAIASDDTRPTWRARYGRLLYDKGNVAQALPHLRFATKAAEDAKEDKWPGWATDAEYRFAQALRKTGAKQEAIDHFNVFLDHATATHPDRRDALSALSALGAPRDH